jgi:probable phosphoglycerate mutase
VTASSQRFVGWGGSTTAPTSILLLRHGQTDLSAERRFAGRGDIPLTRQGLDQARMAARRLAGSGARAIVCSPLARARRTAEAVAEATGAPLVVDDDLAEADFGRWEGLTFAEAQQAWPDQLAAWLASTDAAPPGGETFAAVALRVLGALDRILGAYRQQTVVVVSHVTPIKTILCRALLAPPVTMFRINLDVASLCQADFFEDGNAVVGSLNDTAHLRSRRLLLRRS